MANLGDVGAARTNLLADLRDVRSGGGDVRDYQRTLADLRNIRGDVENADLGHLYNVELKWPNAAREASDPLGEHHLLDWDAPLSQQNSIMELLAKSKSKIVRDVLSRLGDISQPKKVYDEDFGLMTGEDLHRRLALNFEGKSGASKKASNAFAKAGIPGIRYLDQGSRSAGTGSRNYVMFDDQFPEIVSRNGVSLSDLLRR